MIKRVVRITSGIESISDVINNFISNHLRKNEYVIDIKYIKNGERFKSYEIDRVEKFETIIAAIVHIGELK